VVTEHVAASKRERRLGAIVLAVVGAVGLLFAVAGGITTGVSGLILFLGLTALILGIGAVIFGRPAWALIGSRKLGAVVLTVGMVLVVGGAALAPARSPVAEPQAFLEPVITTTQISATTTRASNSSPPSAASAPTTATTPSPTSDAALAAAAQVAASAEADRQAALTSKAESDRLAAEAAAAAQAESDRQAAEAAAAAQAESDRQAAEAAAAAQAESDRQAAEDSAAAQAEADRQAAARAETDRQSRSANPPSPPSAGTVSPGAFCSNVGAVGVTVKGTPMVCSNKAGDPRARWRSAG
jgi:flagellar biosynthesis GTPase FlhF